VGQFGTLTLNASSTFNSNATINGGLPYLLPLNSL
jgi:hypothetical protein